MQTLVSAALCAAMLLWAIPAWANPVRRVVKDFNRDGHVDVMTSSSDGGSGYRAHKRCIRDGASQRVVCLTHETTVYSPFAALTLTGATPSVDARLLTQLKRPKCVAPNINDPGQGAMWALAKPAHRGNKVALTLAPLTQRGMPRATPAVCLDQNQAQRLRGAFAWDAQGNARGNAAPGRVVVFPASRYPRPVLSAGRFRVYTLAGAVAVYDSANNRHQWIASYADGADEGFKMDRWQRLGAFKATLHGFGFTVRRLGRMPTQVSVTFPK